MRLELDLSANRTSLFTAFERIASGQGVLRVDSRGLSLEASVGGDRSHLSVAREQFRVFHPESVCFESGVSVSSIACLVTSHGMESGIHVVFVDEDSELMMLFMCGDSCLSAARIKTSNPPRRVAQNPLLFLDLAESSTTDLDNVLSRLQHFPPETNQVSLSWDVHHMQLFVQAEHVDLCCMLQARIIARDSESLEVTCHFDSVVKMRQICLCFRRVCIYRFDDIVRFRFSGDGCWLDIDLGCL